MILRGKRALRKARGEGYDEGRAETPVVHVAAGDLNGARHAARRLEHPNGDRGRAIHATKRQDLQGYRGGVLLRGWGTDERLVDEARQRGMVIVDVFQ